jgi:hypothetical protein
MPTSDTRLPIRARPIQERKCVRKVSWSKGNTYGSATPQRHANAAITTSTPSRFDRVYMPAPENGLFRRADKYERFGLLPLKTAR